MFMTTITLTDLAVRRVKPDPDRLEIFDAKVPGLGLGITEKGGRSVQAGADEINRIVSTPAGGNIVSMPKRRARL
jgi:hypothetical protein